MAAPNTDIIQHRLNWTLRFPLPGPAPNDPKPWSQTLPSSVSLIPQTALANSHNILRSLWIKQLLVGCAQVHPASTRSNPNSANRPFIPAALFSFFDGAISLSQCSQLVAQHLANSGSHVRAAAQEFIRTEGAQKFTYTRLHTEVIDCCRIYHLPPPPSPGSLPSPAGALHFFFLINAALVITTVAVM